MLSPDFGTVDFKSLASDNAILRAISPEAAVTLNGARLTTWVGWCRADVSYQVDPPAFHYFSHTTSQPVAPFHWEPGLRNSPSYSQWPPQGVTLQVKFGPPAVVKRPEHANVTVIISYEMYVGIPLNVQIGQHPLLRNFPCEDRQLCCGAPGHPEALCPRPSPPHGCLSI